MFIDHDPTGKEVGLFLDKNGNIRAYDPNDPDSRRAYAENQLATLQHLERVAARDALEPNEDGTLSLDRFRKAESWLTTLREVIAKHLRLIARM